MTEDLATGEPSLAPATEDGSVCGGLSEAGDCNNARVLVVIHRQAVSGCHWPGAEAC